MSNPCPGRITCTVGQHIYRADTIADLASGEATDLKPQQPGKPNTGAVINATPAVSRPATPIVEKPVTPTGKP